MNREEGKKLNKRKNIQAPWEGLSGRTFNFICYRPEFNEITGSVNASILLQHIIYYWNWKGKKPFYKFKEPCLNHDSYTKGDSWVEELKFSARQFDTALKKIGVRTKKGQKIMENKPVHYWQTANRLTFYKINQRFVVLDKE